MWKKKSLWIKPGHFLKVNLRPYSTYCTFLIKPYLSSQFTFTASNYAPAARRKIKRNKTSFNYSDCSGHFVAHPLKLFAFSHLPAHKFQQVSEGGGGWLFFLFTRAAVSDSPCCRRWLMRTSLGTRWNDTRAAQSRADCLLCRRFRGTFQELRETRFLSVFLTVIAAWRSNYVWVRGWISVTKGNLEFNRIWAMLILILFLPVFSLQTLAHNWPLGRRSITERQAAIKRAAVTEFKIKILTFIECRPNKTRAANKMTTQKALRTLILSNKLFSFKQ